MIVQAVRKKLTVTSVARTIVRYSIVYLHPFQEVAEAEAVQVAAEERYVPTHGVILTQKTRTTRPSSAHRAGL